MAKQPLTQHKYPDEIEIEGGRMVRLSQLNKDKMINVRGHSIRVGDIPLTAVELNCGHVVRGIALQEKDILFCEEHQQNSVVVLLLSQ
jgi:hypothetical protein